MEIDVVLAHQTEKPRTLRVSESITTGKLSSLKNNTSEVVVDSDHVFLKLNEKLDIFTHVYCHKDSSINLDVRSFGNGNILPVLTFTIEGKSYGIVLEDSFETTLSLWRWNKFSVLDLIKKYNNRTKSAGRQTYITQLINTLRILDIISSEDELYLEI